MDCPEKRLQAMATSSLETASPLADGAHLDRSPRPGNQETRAKAAAAPSPTTVPEAPGALGSAADRVSTEDSKAGHSGKPAQTQRHFLPVFRKDGVRGTQCFLPSLRSFSLD